MKQVVIMRGVSGSGKSTYIKEHFADATVVSADKYFYNKEGEYKFDGSKLGQAHGSCRARFESALKADKTLVVVDNTNTRCKEFKSYLKTAEDNGYEVRVVRLDVPLASLYGRNLHGVPDESVKAMHGRMEPFEGEEVVTQ
jgi:predicted kinase